MRGAQSSTAVVVVKTGLRGQPCGTDHWNARYPDELVHRAQELKAAGVAVKAIVRELGGPSRWTVRRWLDGTRRKPPARIVVRPGSADSKSAANPSPTGTCDAVRKPARTDTLIPRIEDLI
jgi:hypothetical protein